MRFFFVRLLYAIIIRPWLRHIIGVKFENRETFDDLDQFIVVANHNSHFDALSIMAALPGKKLKNTRTVAAGDYFGKSGFTKSLMSFFFNAILIQRNKKEEGEDQTESHENSALDILDENLKKGYSMILFPEGSRGKAGVITDFKKGVAILLKENPNIPFVPVYLDGFGRVLPKDARLIIPLVCKVRFGQPIHPSTHDIDTILEEVRDAIFSLKKEDERDRNRFQFD